MKRSTLYRMLNADRELIYVGITFDPHIRFGDHRAHKVWWDEVATIEVQHFDSREDARVAEQEMIAAQKPMFNVSHRTHEWLEGTLENAERGAGVIEGECDRCGRDGVVSNELGGLCGRCEGELMERGEAVA